jgi:hypothetical protein
MGWYEKWDATAASRRWVDTKILGANKPKGNSTAAGDTYAALTREQWANYVSTFVPLENQLIDYATNKDKPLEAMAEASADVNASFDMQQGALDRRLRGQGVTLNADEQAARNRSFGLSKSLADVGAQNMAGQLTRERQQSVLGNPAPQSTSVGATGG